MLAKNPFLQSSARPFVAVAHGQGAYANTRAALQALDLTPVAGKRILIKPNAGRVALPGEGITTHPEVAAATIDALRAAGAEVAIGESPITGVDATEAFEATGIATVARQRDCPLIDLDRRPPVDVALGEGQVLHRIKVCAEVLEHDLVVSVPVMKMHMHTGVTLSVKNMKGCLWRRSKVKLHMLPAVEGDANKPINIAIADMASALRPHLAIIDGTVGMEGLGPSAGDPKTVDIVVAGADTFAADAVACRLMGTSAEAVPHLALGAARGYGVIDLDAIDVTPDNWHDWAVTFAGPPANLSIQFPNVTVLDNNSCSACQSTVLLFLKRYRDQLFDYFPDMEHLTLAIGKGHQELPEQTLCVGNCTARPKDQRPFVKGCPPVASEILRVLTGKPSIDTKDGRSPQADQTDAS
ncbi:MAG: DUF362 domain-containing protein [Phycisphaerales bacterium]|nr:MAG: DUF362 domain-containing protein [Phycisphaerales bacterium]